MGKRSLAKAYKVFNHDSTTPKWSFPILTIVASVKQGKVQALTWDDGCHFCQDVTDECASNIFTLPINRFNETMKVSDNVIGKLMLDGLGKNCRVNANPGMDIIQKAKIVLVLVVHNIINIVLMEITFKIICCMDRRKEIILKVHHYFHVLLNIPSMIYIHQRKKIH